MRNFLSLCLLAVLLPAAALAAEPVSSVPAASAVQAAPSMEIRFAVAGDIMTHQSQLTAAYDKKCKCYDFTPSFTEVSPLLKNVDVAIANLETTLPGRGYSGFPDFGSPDSLVDAAAGAGFNLFLNANNHCLDKGKAGLLRTLQVLDEKKIPHLGTYASRADYEQRRIFLLRKNGLTVALLNYTYGTNNIPTPKGVVVNRISKSRVSADIAKAREMGVDAVIVFYHFGKEYLNQPDAYQRDMVAHALASGADIVLGGHPHHVQPYGLLQYTKHGPPRLVAYSLGNFVSAQRQPYTDGGMVLYFTLRKAHGADGRPEIDIADLHHTLVWVSVEQDKNGGKLYRVLPIDASLAAQATLKLPPEAIAGMTHYRDEVEAVLKTGLNRKVAMRR